MIILVNAGHGGQSTKTGEYLTPPKTGKKTLHTNGKKYHKDGWFYEGTFNRQISAEFIAQATKAGFLCIPVYMPQADMPLNDIPKAANEMQRIVNTYYKEPCIFLSMHANSAGATTAPQSMAQGVCSFVYQLGSNTAKVAERITKRLQAVFDAYGSKRRAQLVHDQSLTVTRYTSMPAILFELGFFDNPDNADLLMNPHFIEDIAKVMVDELLEIYGPQQVL